MLIWIGDEYCCCQEWSQAIDAYNVLFKCFHPKDKSITLPSSTPSLELFIIAWERHKAVCCAPPEEPQLESVIAKGWDPHKSLTVMISYFQLGNALHL
jgi:hypothetical protein